MFIDYHRFLLNNLSMSPFSVHSNRPAIFPCPHRPGPRFFVPSLVLCTPPGPPKEEEDDADTEAAPSDVANGAHGALLSSRWDLWWNPPQNLWNMVFYTGKTYENGVLHYENGVLHYSLLGCILGMYHGSIGIFSTNLMLRCHFSDG